MVTKNQKGFVLFFTLFILLIFTIIVSTIYGLTANEISAVNKSITKTQTVLAAESCIAIVIQWLKENYSTSDICLKKFSGSDLLFGSQDMNKVKTENTNNSITYNCEIQCLNEATKNGIGLGTQIDMDTGYGSPKQIESGSLGSGSYYYKIQSIGTNLISGSSIIETLVSVNY